MGELELSTQPKTDLDKASYEILKTRKLEVVRAQLGTALSLFMQDRDPYSVHVLAAGACEIAEGLVKEAELPTLSTHILRIFPSVHMPTMTSLRNRYWNAFKHLYKPKSEELRDDREVIGTFTDKMNDVVLFLGWADYAMVAKRLPTEAQIFLAWWYATNPNKTNANDRSQAANFLFNDIEKLDRVEQKRQLRRKTEKYRDHKELLADPKTEKGPLVVKNVL